jgi:hypothetical protein
MALSKEEMRLYQRARRAKLKVAPVCASCLEKENEIVLLRGRVQRLESAQLKTVEPVKQGWRKDKVVGCRKFGE